MKEALATLKKLHQLSTPIKRNFEDWSKISSHHGLQIFYNTTLVDIGLRVSQSGQSNRNSLLTPLNFLRTMNLLFVKQQVYHYPISEISSGIFMAVYRNMHLNSGAQNRKCTFIYYTDTFCSRLYFLKLTLSKVYFQENSIQSKF